MPAKIKRANLVNGIAKSSELLLCIFRGDNIKVALHIA